MVTGMTNSIDLIKVEQELLDRQLKHHYHVAEREFAAKRRPVSGSILTSLQKWFSPRQPLCKECPA